MTATQAVSSMLAALTGAVTASRLGIAGTLIGAAFMSLASTVGSAIYKHYITSSNARLRAAAATFAPKASHSAVAEAVARHHAEQDQTLRAPALGGQGSPSGARSYWAAPRAGSSGSGSSGSAASGAGPELGPGYPVREYGAPPVRGRGYVSPDGAETQIFGTVRPNGDAASARTQAFSRDRDGRDGRGHDAPTAWERGAADTVRDVAAAGLGGPPGLGPGGDAGAAGRGTDAGWVWPWSRRRWAMVAATALGVFVISMGVVTAFEALAGKPLDAVVWHQHGSGTTVGGLVGGSGGHHPSPSTSPSPSHSPGSSHSARPSHSPSSSSSPTPTTTSPTPTPSGSPSPSSSSTGASSPATTNSPPAAQSASPGASSPSP